MRGFHRLGFVLRPLLLDDQVSLHVGLEVGLGLGGAGDVDWAGQHLVVFLL